MNREVGTADWWTVHRGLSPVLATAIHNGHAVRPAIAALMAISEGDRLREEDPFTDFAGCDVPNRIVFHRSRFEVDLNRPRDAAIYLSPEQAWGIDVWNKKPGPNVMRDTLSIYDAYYSMLRHTLRQLEQYYGCFVVLDIHSYNHRRDGPGSVPSDPESAPEINIGTYSMDRDRWAHVIEPFMGKLSKFKFRGHRMDVRENIAFEGRGEQTRFIHESFPQTGCAIAIEFKKFFMDEWTGLPDRRALVAIRAMVRSTLPVLEESLRSTR
ncbi:N-formylglutamate amidohydrolase [Phyllobacterium brassicacearum]|uniref:N-formylglutamate amidohydrolase n=1 Tax=Phyllobacterium brassicacearum TaxID=314235 RepID=A0A2P7BVB5_9HYPH|nr:N-formylglutamate amidohydrolase [Phyllobacterium brassicacearum]PSH70414.1 N-formylglutamate amidohydrolase [Phyllobacterium brassicacearum]